MCGIVGFISDREVMDEASLVRMRDALTHRGPDDAGVILRNGKGIPCRPGEKGTVGLAHRRLSIIDLSPAGRQPMSNEDGSVWIVCNGEFYNFADYRQELETKGHRFRSRCDTETILHLYEEYGIDETLRRINGMFAFALWDARRGQLILARDRLGKKPLFYAQPAGGLVFASELGALRAGGFVAADALDLTALDQIWSVGCTVGERTLFKSVRKLCPAQYLVWSGGQAKFHEYWDCPFGVDVRRGETDDALADELEALLTDAIRLRLVADVPVGLFLSGGVDSSVIAALAARLTGGRVASYTIGFPQSDFDEVPHAQAVADHLRLGNTVLTVNEDLSESFDRIAGQFGEPFGDSSAVPTFFVSKLARQHVTVALTGDGGDELFAGYESFRQGMRIWGSGAERRPFLRPLTVPEKLWELKLRWLGFPAAFPLLDGKLGWRGRRKLFTPAYLRAVDRRDTFRDRFIWLDRVRDADLLSRLQYVTLKTWLPDDFLPKVDVMSMAHALECRSPLLDYRIVEFAARLPFAAKMDERGRGKRILRKILGRHVPEKLFDRPKQGFGVPWEHWCRGPLGDALRERWRKLRSPHFRPDAADWLFPAGRIGVNFLQWNAFVTLRHFSP